MTILLKYNVTLEPSSQDDIDYVENNFRLGDRMEHESMGNRSTSIDMFEQCWTIKIKGKIVGYCGVALFAGDSPLAERRILCFMSCENANKAKVTFVRASRLVMTEIVSRSHPWVREFHSAPDQEYRGSVIWHERTLKMHYLGNIEFNNCTLRHYVVFRKELEK